ncbi:histidine kinase [Mycolicibacterium parafortuitum]|uniref:histidine kinase n=1 Tax=Mycolicibacterium parafortuitum TaxID=39692 RepID=A0A7I7U7C9_MYCPF|nr:CHASE3 domain-containing protein [Mycolicibacterium parafortuitum]PQE02364.1 histidine kinase [Mycobacterium sp. EPG1]BBY77292.1 histidine kinase [Mycolicibacterium parafortuitum]
MSPDQRGIRALTVQGWQYVVLAVTGVVVLLGGIAVAVLLQRTDQVSNQLINEIQPARVAAYQLQAALRDQETAVRGYLIAADEQFLLPYDEGRVTEQRAAADIRRLEQARPDLLQDLDAIEEASGAWRVEYAEPVMAGVRPGTPGPVDTALTDIGKRDFDTLRALFDTQNEHLSQARDEGVAELQRIRTLRNAVLLGLAVMFAVTIVALAVLLRHALVRPLSQLAESCRRIAGGNFGEKIVPHGPRDIRLISVDVDNMRQRIVAELEASRAATETLDQHAEELRRSNAELEQFAYVASHDLQEPLRKVASFCQLLEKRYGDKLDERGVEYIGFAVDGAKRMQVLINDLLTFSRVGRLNATESEVDLGAALDVALGNLSAAIEESGAVIERPAVALPTINGDPTLLTMLWQNLIGNAVKFHRDGVAPHIVIDCDREADDESSNWTFTVTDNGIGIAPEFSEKVFVIFQRLHGRDAYTGTGIGLALCKKIVEHHGGTIGIDTSYQEGTRFRFTLPVTEGDTADTALEGSAS